MAMFEKTKNPLNIRAGKNHWNGQSGTYRGFCVFESVRAGGRASVKLLLNYIGKGYNTPYAIINRWAPPFENDTNKYVKFVSKPPMFENKEIHDVADLYTLTARMCFVETRYELNLDEFKLWLRAAVVEYKWNGMHTRLRKSIELLLGMEPADMFNPQKSDDNE